VPVIAAVLESRRATLSLRRSLARGGPPMVACRSLGALERLVTSRLVDAVVVTPRGGRLAALHDLRSRFPSIPVLAFAAFRPDDGELLLECRRDRVSEILVEGVDDVVAGEILARCSASAERRRVLADAPRVLQLADPLQGEVWRLLLDRVDRPTRTAAVAKRLKVSREHLSRQFGAGGAPNLKRVIDLTRVACAAHLLQNPGFEVRTVVRVLNFASPSHLSGTARRIAGVRATGLRDMGPRGVLAAFARENTRSRLG
jgi:AraC-like DNA-binding protein